MKTAKQCRLGLQEKPNDEEDVDDAQWADDRKENRLPFEANAVKLGVKRSKAKRE